MILSISDKDVFWMMIWHPIGDMWSLTLPDLCRVPRQQPDMLKIGPATICFCCLIRQVKLLPHIARDRVKQLAGFRQCYPNGLFTGYWIGCQKLAPNGLWQELVEIFATFTHTNRIVVQQAGMP